MSTSRRCRFRSILCVRACPMEGTFSISAVVGRPQKMQFELLRAPALYFFIFIFSDGKCVKTHTQKSSRCSSGDPTIRCCCKRRSIRLPVISQVHTLHQLFPSFSSDRIAHVTSQRLSCPLILYHHLTEQVQRKLMYFKVNIYYK